LLINIVLSDPKKKAYYDKYGTLDEDNFNFDEFMKSFPFDFLNDLFDDGMFGKMGFNMMGGGNPFEGRHNIKLMYQRKKAYKMPFKHEHEDKEHPGEVRYNIKAL
jgi:DnaJ-class molecular chaperone